MAVQNVHVITQIDGRKTNLTGGPRAKDGGLYQRILFRENGGISDTELRTEVRVSNDEIIVDVYTIGNADHEKKELKLKFKR